MYGKIFERMFTGTMYGSGPVVFAVWAYVIANTKPPGVVSLNQKMLAATIGCSTEEIRSAIEFLMRPDPESATREEEGRRLVHVSGLDYHVVSWQKYRDMRDEEERREYMRLYMRNRRSNEKKLTEVNKVNGQESLAKLAKAEAEAEAERVGRAPRSAGSKTRGTRFAESSLPDDWRAFCTSTRPDLDPEATFDSFADFWRGKAGAAGVKADWAATWRNWVRKETARAKPAASDDRWWMRGNVI